MSKEREVLLFRFTKRCMFRKHLQPLYDEGNYIVKRVQAAEGLVNGLTQHKIESCKAVIPNKGPHLLMFSEGEKWGGFAVTHGTHIWVDGERIPTRELGSNNEVAPYKEGVEKKVVSYSRYLYTYISPLCRFDARMSKILYEIGLSSQKSLEVGGNKLYSLQTLLWAEDLINKGRIEVPCQGGRHCEKLVFTLKALKENLPAELHDAFNIASEVLEKGEVAKDLKYIGMCVKAVEEHGLESIEGEVGENIDLSDFFV